MTMLVVIMVKECNITTIVTWDGDCDDDDDR